MFLIAAATLIFAAFGTPTAAKAAAPAPPIRSTAPVAVTSTIVCSTNALSDGQVCYQYSDPQVTDPTYSCPEGSTPIEGDPTHCLVTKTGTVYVDRPQIPATYKCPDGYTAFEDTCRKLITPGYEDVIDRPITTPESYVCPPDYLWSYSYTHQGVTTVYTSLVSYKKDDNDPHKCHRQSANILPTPTPGAVQGKYNQDNPEFVDAILVPAVYGDCPAGYEVAPDTTKCQKWIPPVYDYTDPVVDVPAHPGDCPEGYDVYSDTQCSKTVTEDETIDAILTAGTPFCGEGQGTLVNGQCQLVVPCPPVETTTICYNGETIVVNTADLGQYKGYTIGACVPPPPVCPPGTWQAKDNGEGEGIVCRTTNWNWCHSLAEGNACDRHWEKSAGMDETQYVILLYREASLNDPMFPFYQTYSDLLAAAN